MKIEREGLLERVRRAAGSRPRRTHHTPPRVSEEIVRQVSRDAELIELFQCHARRAGADAEVVPGQTLGDWLAALVGRLDAGTVLIDPEVAGAPGLRERLAPAAMIAGTELDDALLFSADLAVVSARAGVAETGSIVCTAGSGRWRGLSLIPPRLVAVLHAAHIVADIVDLFTALAAGEHGIGYRGNVNIITGPSRTADIEGELVTGVHGPGQVWVAVVT